MTEAVPAYVIDYLNTADDDDDLLITDISRGQDSVQDKQQLEKWKQRLRIELIREQYEAKKKHRAVNKPALHRLLQFPTT